LTAADPTARLFPQPLQAEIGQPVLWTLEVRHAANTRVSVGAAPELDQSWVLLDGPRTSSSEAGFRIVWEALSLEAGLRTLPVPELGWQNQPLSVTAEPLAVRGELAAEEDAPRALRGAIDAGPDSQTPIWLTGLALGAALLLVLAALWWRARARRQPAPRAPSPEQQLQWLRERAASGAVAPRDAVYALTQLLRAALDAREGRHRAALTDAQWAMDVGEPWAALLARAESIKYAGIEPSPLLLGELLDRAAAELGRSGEVRS
jgi:hypothetical protein